MRDDSQYFLAIRPTQVSQKQLTEFWDHLTRTKEVPND
jgi:preprotein translocase subunit YajC